MSVLAEQASWILRLPTKPDTPGPEAYHPACGRVHKRRDCSLVPVERTVRRVGGKKTSRWPVGNKRIHMVPAALAPDA